MQTLIHIIYIISNTIPILSIDRSLVDFLLCVGNIAPVCLDKIIEVKSPYFHSPHDCHFSDEEYSEIQRYKSCKHLHQSTTASSITYSTLPSRTYESNASSVTFQTSRPTNQQHKESNSSRNLRKFLKRQYQV